MKNLLYDPSREADGAYAFENLSYTVKSQHVQDIFNKAVSCPMFTCFETLSKWNGIPAFVATYTDEVLSLEIECEHGMRALDIVAFFDDPCVVRLKSAIKVNKLTIDARHARRNLSTTQAFNLLRSPRFIDPFVDEEGYYHYSCVPMVKENKTNVEFILEGTGKLPPFKIKRENIIKMNDPVFMERPGEMKALVVTRRTAEHVAFAIAKGKVNRMREY